MNKIINFHDLDDHRWFEDVIDLLNNKYRLVSLNELLEYFVESNLPRNICHLTFDDGDISFYNLVFPILQKHNIPASVFVSPDSVINQENFWFQEIKGYNDQNIKYIASEVLELDINDLRDYRIENILKCCKIDMIWTIINEYKTKYKIPAKQFMNMTANQLLEIDNSELINIGGHSLSHPVLSNEDEHKAKDEIAKSLNDLADILNHPIITFAYPNGYSKLDFGQREINILKDVGCKISFSTDTANFDLNTNLLSFPRFSLSYGGSLFIRTKLLLGPFWDLLKSINNKSDYSERTQLLKIIN